MKVIRSRLPSSVSSVLGGDRIWRNAMNAVRFAALAAALFGVMNSAAWADAGSNVLRAGVQTAFLGQLFGWPYASLGGGISVGYPSAPVYSAPVYYGATSSGVSVPAGSSSGAACYSGRGCWTPVGAPSYSPSVPSYSPSVPTYQLPTYQLPTYRSTVPSTLPVTMPAGSGVGSGAPAGPAYYYEVQPVNGVPRYEVPRNSFPQSVPGGGYGSGGLGGAADVNSPFYP